MFGRLAIGTAAVLAVLGAGCGDRSARVVRIGVLADCESGFSAIYEDAIAGAELPLLTRGARLRGAMPSAGVMDATVAGTRVVLMLGCTRDFSRATTLAAMRLLVEQRHAHIVVGPDGGVQGLVVRDYARRQHGVTFVYAGFDQSTTLVDPAPNVFRFRVSMAQWAAGLGSYAYRTLGWRTAVTVGEAGPATWGGVAGFVAEFCSLGGNIAKRIWVQGGDLANVAGDVPSHGIDGVFVPTSYYDTEGFVAALSRQHPRLGDWLVGGDGVLSQGLSDPRLLGVVAANPTPWIPTRAWSTYATTFARAFRGMNVQAANALNHYDSAAPVLEALERVDGDISHGERRLMAALANLTFDSPEGPRHLDAHHQAVGLSYLGQLIRSKNGKLAVRQIRTVANVEQTFGGHLTSTTPAPSSTEPPCVHGHPPPWARASR